MRCSAWIEESDYRPDDRGLSFGGARWEFSDAPSSGIFGNPIVYTVTASKACVRGWVDRVLYFPERVIEDALSEVPDEWIDGERGELESLGEKLLTRRKAVAQSVDRALSGVFARP